MTNEVASKEQVDRNSAKIADLEAAIVNITTKLDTDSGTTGGASDYASTTSLPTILSWDVTNDSDKALRFKDASGKEFLLNVGATETITGMTPQLDQWETDGVISKIATP